MKTTTASGVGGREKRRGKKWEEERERRLKGKDKKRKGRARRGMGTSLRGYIGL